MSTVTYSQTNRPISVTTPLGKDKLLLVGFSGSEAISRPFSFQLELKADNKNQQDIAFDKLLGQKITVQLTQADNKPRYFSGICSRFSQGEKGTIFTAYRLEIVPQFWLLTHVSQSRTFQQLSVPDILKQVLTGLDVTYELQGTFEKRDYCVQYRETDFNFASRLMEEEGIYYFFKHSADGHKMVLANTPQSHSDMPGPSKVVFETVESGHPHDEDRIYVWEKSQELRAGKCTLWDHCFELPHQHLDAQKPVQESLQVGKVTHKLKVGGNDKLELFDYPGEYAQRFDGINPSGGEQSSEVQKIFKDNTRTVEIRMQEEALSSLVINGASGCRQWTSGFKFTLDRHFDGDGQYVVTSVQHSAQQGSYRSDETSFHYQNTFTCIPAALPFRPPRVTPKPFVQGTQTAVVVGTSGQEIFTDKYGRVKVQFHWDRQGKSDANSSCWVRVGSIWAGKGWGAVHVPRIGQEVIVAFEEGDPDRPIIIGSVYNADMMPPYTLPDNMTQSGIKSRSTLQGGPDNFNELRFEDKKGSEQVYFHAEKNFDRVVENNDTLKVGSDKADDGSQTIEIWKDRTETVKQGNELVTIEQGNRTVNVNTGNDSHNIKTGNRSVVINMGNDSLAIKMGNQTTKLDLGASSTEAMQSITLKVGQNSITIDQMGVTIKGMMVTVEGQIQTAIKGVMTQVQGSAMTQIQGGITMIG
ncbi:MAG TPA: type VI secretion system tip protein TssI/VgrG [Pirellulales bacterium]|nr:type VI secretion system tip protein TssI/VgrG [Pirellulales bacterium]